jgi:hypothetical protein
LAEYAAFLLPLPDRQAHKAKAKQEQGGGFRHRLQGDLVDRKEPIVPGADGSDKGRRVDEADEGLIFLRKRGLDSCFLVEIMVWLLH